MTSALSSTTELCALTWGDTDGYVCLSVLDRSDSSWRDVKFKWPQDKPKVDSFLTKAKSTKKDVYWCPNVFSKPKRSEPHALPTDMLWADLDEADPRNLPEELKPTAWWETSPGRYQALWKMSMPVEPGLQRMLNKNLTYKIGADKGGWDSTQVLRLPGTLNHKYKDVRVSKARVNGRIPNPSLLVQDLADFQVSGGGEHSETPATADLPSPDSILKSKKGRRISARAKQLLKARERNAVVGRRSETLWELECLLAESGLNANEILSLCKHSVWNKFEGRHDEMERLARETRKAIAHVADQHSTSSKHKPDTRPDLRVVEDEEEPEENEHDLTSLTWGEFDRDRTPIKWLVAGVWGNSEVGFISGLPKSYKSWLALDLAVSVATGTRFLSSFQCLKENVLLVQEEDPKSVLQERLGEIAWAKNLIGANANPPGDPQAIEMWYDLPDKLKIVSNTGFTVTTEEHLEWLVDEIRQHEAKLVILDPLMMIAEGMDEFKAFDMMAKVFKPLKKVRHYTQAAVCVVHHHVKNTEKTGGAAMYGAVSGWAWEESALHLQVDSPGKLIAERFSKRARLAPLTIEVPDIEDEGWRPHVYEGTESPKGIEDILETYESGISMEELAEMTKMGRDTIKRRLSKMLEGGKVEKVNGPRTGKSGRRAVLWKAAR